MNQSADLTHARFDHIAYGVEHPVATFATLRSDFGTEWVQWDHNVGFSGLQVAFPNGFKIEVLHPFEEERNPFLRRFLDRRGAGPHHLTFRVDDIEKYLARLDELGVSTVAQSLDDPAWREAFVHPRGGIGILVQLAQSDNDHHTDAPLEWVALERGEPVHVVRIEQFVADIAAATRLLTALDGVPLSEGVDEIGPWNDLVWSSDRVIRLRQSADAPDGEHRCVVVSALPRRSKGGLPNRAWFKEPALGARFEAIAR